MHNDSPAGIAISLSIHRAHGIVTCDPHIPGQIANFIIRYRYIMCTLFFFFLVWRGWAIKSNQPFESIYIYFLPYKHTSFSGFFFFGMMHIIYVFHDDDNWERKR